MASTQPTLNDWLTTDDVALLFGIHPRKVLRMIREDRIKAVKKGWVWLIHESEVPTSWPPAA